MTTQVLYLPDPVFRCVSPIKHRGTLSELGLTVESLGNTYKFTIVRPFVSAAPNTSATDIQCLLRQQWTLATVLRHDNQGSITYTLECVPAVSEKPRLSIHARGYQDHTGTKDDS